MNILNRLLKVLLLRIALRPTRSEREILLLYDRRKLTRLIRRKMEAHESAAPSSPEYKTGILAGEL